MRINRGEVVGSASSTMAIVMTRDMTRASNCQTDYRDADRDVPSFLKAAQTTMRSRRCGRVPSSNFAKANSLTVSSWSM